MAVNISSTVPAAPAGSTNVTYQTDGSGNISGYVPTAATELTADSVNLTGQGANIGSTDLITSPLAGLYRVSAYIIVTTADGVSSTLPSVVISWTDQNNTSTSESLTLTATQSGDSLTTHAQGTGVISSKASAITYSTTSYASNTASKMKYALRLRVESLG